MPLSERMNAGLINLIFLNCVSIRDLSHWAVYCKFSGEFYFFANSHKRHICDVKFVTLT